ncbi:MAG: hypothetical protein IPI34_11080 [bacterium]|nr:hypothetical protein [bacterium]
MTKNHKQLYMFGNADNGDHCHDVQQFMPFMVPAGQNGWAAMLQDLPADAWYYGSFRIVQPLERGIAGEAYIKYDSTVSANDGYFEVWVDAVLRRQVANLNSAMSQEVMRSTTSVSGTCSKAFRLWNMFVHFSTTFIFLHQEQE